jgi:hypothetical protein
MGRLAVAVGGEAVAAKSAQQAMKRKALGM